jgi:alpha-L-rhamnosidase
VAISSDTPRRGTFECSNERLNRFHENVVWSQRDNFVSVPTDCPQRDERLGWTGDAQAFAPTASVLFDVEAFWASWLRDLALEQDPVLGVPSVVPDMVLRGEPRYGRAGWGDAATIVPWASYEAYGDPHILAAQWDSMVGWVDSLRARLGPDGFLPESMQFGDWLDPDAPVERPWEAKADATFLANAYFAQSARLLGRSAAVLGRPAEAADYRDLADRQAAATWRRWADHAITSQTGCAVSLQFEICPAGERERVAAALARLVRDAGGRVATGFLGTPLVLPALVDAGLIDEAYLMLLCRSMPSWLYQVDQGASTVWERWDAIRPDGSIHPGTMTSLPDTPEVKGREPHMLSFNHYAYGAVIDWVYRHVAGLAPDIEQPGYRHVVFAPKPSVDIDWARATVESRFGTVATAWRLTDDGDLHVELDLPFGTTGRFRAPATAGTVVSLDGGAAAAEPDLGPGHHVIVVTKPRIAGGAPEEMPEALVTEPAI